MTFSLDPNSTTPGRLDMNMVMTEPATGKSFYANYAVTAAEGTGYEDISVSGRFYAGDYGYVDVVTVTPVRTLDTADYPSSGVLKFTGAAGSTATMTFGDGGSYQIACSDGATITGVLQ